MTSPANDVTVWINDVKGDSVPVRLKSSGTGYIGPQGEVYNNLPAIETLEYRYGR